LWARKAKTLIDEILGRDLSVLDILVVMLDGIYLCDGLCSVAAIGIDRSGTKHVLGFRIGSSENAEVCRDLVGEDLITFFTLEVPSTLNRSLLSTNARMHSSICVVTLEESGVGEAILTKRTDGWPADCTYPKRYSIEYLAATIWINSKLPWRRMDIALNPQ